MGRQADGGVRQRDGAYLLYDALLLLGSALVLPWAALRALVSPGFRRGLRGRLGAAPDLPPGPGRVLVHGVSVGEIKAARPLVRLLQEAHPECSVVVCSTTESGRQTARRTFPELPVVAFPLDLAWACRRFLRRIKPSAVLILELEIWPNFLRACSRQGIPVAIVNGRITGRSMAGYLRVQRLLPQFDRIRLYAVQSERYAERFRRLAVPESALVVTGNLKYDNLPDSGDAQSFAASPWPGWIAGRPAVALGSTHPGEEIQILRAARAQPPDGEVLWVVVPRHPRRAGHLGAVLRRECPQRVVRLRSEQPEGEPIPPRSVLVVDTFGELEHVYRACSVAFVGGSLVPHGGQNVLEPAALARPCCVGPHTENFAEEVAWISEAGGLRRARDASELLDFMGGWLRDPAAAAAAGRAANRALAARRGGARATLRALESAGLLAGSNLPSPSGANPAD